MDLNREEYENILKKICLKQGIRLTAIQKYTNAKFETNTIVTNSADVNICYQFYRFINEIHADYVNEMEKDVWDVRNLSFKVALPEHNPYYTLSFELITQLWLKPIIKKYCHYRLQSKTLMTVKSDMKCFNKLSAFLKKHHPNAKNLLCLDRVAMEKFIAYIAKDGMYAKGVNKHISVMKCFLETAPYLEIKDVPSYNIILSSDFRKTVHKEVETYSKDELRRMNKYINELPIQIARMFFVIQNVGMRPSDLCIMKASNLKMTDNGDFILSYLQPKTHKYNTIPIDKIVGETIQAAIKDSQTEFGPTCQYVFANSKDRPISCNYFRRKINEMAEAHSLKKDDGTPLFIKSSIFRHTVATQYANMGVDMEVLRLMMGHSDFSVLKHYVKIHGTSMLEAMAPILEHDAALIDSIGKEISIVQVDTSQPLGLSLPNGYCAKPISEGICSHANACYACRMFKPSQQYLFLYQQQLDDAEKRLQIAKINNHMRLTEIYETLITNLMKIINQFDEEVQDGQNGCMCEKE